MRRYTVSVDGTAYTIDVEETAADRFEVTVEDRTFEAALEPTRTCPAPRSPPRCPRPTRRAPPRRRRSATVAAPGAAAVAGARAALPPRTTPGTPGLHAGGSDVLAAPMPGVILEVVVARRCRRSSAATRSSSSRR